MNDVVKWFTVYLINSVWQIPVLAACTAVVLKAAARSGAKLHYRLWVGCLLLATVLPALPSMNRAPRFSGHRSGSVSVAIWGNETKQVASSSDRIAIYADEIVEFTSKRDVVQLLLWFYSLSLLVGGVRLLRRLAVTHMVVRGASRIQLSPCISSSLQRSAETLGLPPIDVYGSGRLRLPATVSWPRAMLLVPVEFLSVPEKDAVAAMSHELAHIRRHDFATNLAIETLTLVAFYHPAVHWIKRRIADSREVICDEMAAEATTGCISYARSLLSLAEATCLQATAPNLSLGVLEGNTLEKRITTLIEVRLPLTMPFKVFSTVCCWVVLIALSVGVASLSIRPTAAQAATSEFKSHAPEGTPTGQIQLAATNTPQAAPSLPDTNDASVRRIGGGVKGPIPIYQPEPEFSEEAHKAKFQGVVTVQLIVDKDGQPQNVHVTQGVGMGLDEKAVEAVQHYRFKPATQNGKPVSVGLNVEVNFEIF